MSRAEPPRRPGRTRLTAAQRRQELAETAAAEFHRHGFHQVTLGGVAAAVGVTAPAVYRHYANKNALLAGAVESGLEEIEAALRAATADGGELDDILRHLTTAAMRRPDFWTLSQREMRYLHQSEQERARSRFRAVTDEIAGAISRWRPELDDGERDVLVTAAMAVLSTPSTQPTTLPPTRLAPILREAAEAAGTATLAPPGDPDAHGPSEQNPGPAPAAEHADRAAQILDTACTLFHRRGYAAVSLDDIGAAVGIAGPSIYHHYGSKAELLVATFDRVLAALPAVNEDTVPSAAMRSYIDLARFEREAIGTFATETINLPAGDRPRIERALADDLASWTAMLRRERPGLDNAEAALLVQAARAAVHDVARLGRLHRRPTLPDELLAITAAVFATPLTVEEAGLSVSVAMRPQSVSRSCRRQF